MVNLLETLYGLTALSMLLALVSLVRGRRSAARRFAIAGAIGILLSVFFYWHLRSPT
jgi:hypothetical protein